jgi:hypothetical protein
MDTSDLLKRAWEAVEASGVPEFLQEVAFREAVEHLRAESDTPVGAGSGHSDGDGNVKTRKKTTGRKQPAANSNADAPVDEDTFFSRLAEESGVDETDLRDVLALSGNTVHVTPATRKLGDSRAQGARNVTALVAGAKAFGLGEDPVDAIAVHDELKRKNLWDPNNFAGNHLGALAGFNQGANRTEIRTTSKWDKDFTDAVDQALGRNKDENGE